MKSIRVIKATLQATAFLVLIVLGACASDAPTRSPAANGELRGKIQACKTGDKEVSRASQCIQDDAACYPLSNGNYCTGPRGNVCPTGSVAIPQQASCPTGYRCFNVGSNLNCGIRYQ